MAVGVAGRVLSGGLRAASIVPGLLVVVFALIVTFFPVVGVYTHAFLVSTSFFLIGIDSIAAGITGTTTMKNFTPIRHVP